MAYPHHQSHSARPSLPPVPPQLKHHPNSLPSAAPPLPPVPTHYRAQAAADHSRLHSHQQQQQQQKFQLSSPILSPFSLTLDNLRLADQSHYSSPQPPRPHTTQPNPSNYRTNTFTPAPSSHSPHSNRSLHPAVDLSPPRPPVKLSLDTAFLPTPGPISRSQSNSPSPRSISLPILDLNLLTSLYRQHFELQPDPLNQLQWASKVFKFIERSQSLEASSPSLSHSSASQPSKISEPVLVKYTDVALKTVLRLAETAPPQSQVLAEALYLRGDLASTGSFPSYCAKDLRMAFRDFESAAQLGCYMAWFRIGREYESCQDWSRALRAYEHGLAFEECACIFRLGVSYLLGQMSLPVDMVQAVVYLKKAAQLANEESPQPAYTYGMMLAGEFDSFPVIPSEIFPLNLNEAKYMIEKAAYLGFSAAQYKLGWCYEYSQLTCPFDPLLSVEYYSLASKQGECEADMALSKWFLCGAQGYFAPNEQLAVTFAEKAARKGLGSAMFAIGYYLEVGIGGRQDAQAALHWYQRSWDETANEDARERLDVLEDGGSMLSRQEYEQQLDQKLVRKHTLAEEQNPVSRMKAPSGLRRRETMQRAEEASRVAEVAVLAQSMKSPHAGSGSPSPPVGSMPTTPNSTHLYSSPTRSRSKNQNMPVPNLRMARSQSPTPPHLISRQHSLDPSSYSGPPHRPTLDRHGSSNSPVPRMISRTNGFQLTDDGPQLPNSNASIPLQSSAANTKTQFNSFADMGIQTAKAKKTEDCIIV